VCYLFKVVVWRYYCTGLASNLQHKEGPCLTWSIFLYFVHRLAAVMNHLSFPSREDQWSMLGKALIFKWKPQLPTTTNKERLCQVLGFYLDNSSPSSLWLRHSKNTELSDVSRSLSDRPSFLYKTLFRTDAIGRNTMSSWNAFKIPFTILRQNRSIVIVYLRKTEYFERKMHLSCRSCR